MRAIAMTVLCAGMAAAGVKHDFQRPVFVYLHHPDPPLTRYAAGELGIPAPEYARLYLYAAYRYLDGRPFTAAERDAFLKVFRLRTEPVGFEDAGWKRWKRLRATMPVPAPAHPRGANEQIAIRGYEYRIVCADDAFASAAATLGERVRQFGRDSRELRFWLEGEDAAIAACFAPDTPVPAAAPAGMPALIRADREYQTGAVLFRTQRLQEAAAQFQRVANDPASPWRVWGPYMQGRILLWRARLTQDENEYKPLLVQAVEQFQKVLRDPTLRATHAGAERLLQRALLITEPVRGLERLAKRLDSPRYASTRATDLFTYLSSLDAYAENEKQPVLPADRLSVWTRTLKSGEKTAYPFALKQWKRSGSNAWLFVAAVKASAAEPGAGEIAGALSAVPPDVPGGTALHYHAARLLAERGEFERARSEIDGVLQAVKALPSAHNRAAGLKAQMAPDLDTFLRMAPQAVIMASDEMDRDEFRGNDVPRTGYCNAYGGCRAANESARHAAALKALDRLDLSAARIFNTRIPMEVLREIALRDGPLPPHLQNELRLMVWTRSVLLGRFEIAREMGPMVAALYPAAGSEVAAFLANPSGENAAFVLLKLPGARPYMSWGYGRDLAADRRDEWARNWWYRFTPKEMYAFDLPYWSYGSWGTPAPMEQAVLPDVAFLTAEQKRRAQQEWSDLGRGERGLEWIAGRIVRAIQAEPNRPRAAETLYRALEANSFIQWAWPPDAELPHPGLKSARDLLITRFRQTSWARKVPELRLNLN